MKFEIQKKYVVGLGTWLQKLTLSGRESRERTKFVELLAADVQENEAMRLEILKKYADVDPETNEPLVIEEGDNKHYNVKDENIPPFTKELAAYLDENFVVEGDGNKNKLKVIKQIVLDTQEKIAPEIAMEYDKWCEAFEKMEE